MHVKRVRKTSFQTCFGDPTLYSSAEMFFQKALGEMLIQRLLESRMGRDSKGDPLFLDVLGYSSFLKDTILKVFLGHDHGRDVYAQIAFNINVVC